METPVTFDRLFGVLSVPEGKASKGVVLVHGWSGYRCGPHRMFVSLARALCDAGVASLRFDLAGRGDSGGEYGSVDLDTMINNTRAAVTLLREHVEKVYICGICSGGNVSLGAASLDGMIDGLILLSTPLFMRQKEQLGVGGRKRSGVIMDYARKAIQPQTWYRLVKGKVNLRGVRDAVAGEESDEDRKHSSRDIMADLHGYTGEMLFIYGSNDTESPGAPEYYKQFTSENGIESQFETVEGSDHNFYTAEWERQAIEKVVSWVSR